MIPVTFGDCSGWLVSPPQGRALRRGAVIVPAFGFEDLCARRSLRILAERLAAAGLPTLRYDPTGTGNALPAEPDADLLPRWRADLAEAVAHLKALTGVDEVVLVGLRLGALVAAGHDGPLAGLALIAPPLSGRSYLRESAVLARIIAPLETPPAAGLTVAGFTLNAATAEALRALAWPDRAPASRCLVVAPGEGGAALAERFAKAGAAVTERPFAGYERMICDPTASEAPLEVIAQVAAWAAEGAQPALASAAPSPAPAAPASGRLGTPAFTEEALAFGPGGRLAGILCRPAAPTGRLLIMTNAGGQPQASWAGMQVAFARALAAEGTASLRMDLTGHGDSSAPSDPPTPFYYDAELRHDLTAAIDLAAAQGFTDIALAGHCSGAHHAFHVAVADARVRRLVLTNLQCFIWGPRYSIPLGAWMASMPSRIDRQKRAADEESGGLARSWARLTARAVTLIRSTGRPVMRALLRLSGRVAGTERGAGSVAEGFAALSRRGVQVALCFSEGDPALDELALYMGLDGAEALALPGVSRTVIAGADHVLSQAPARAAMYELLRAVTAEERRKAA